MKLHLPATLYKAVTLALTAYISIATAGATTFMAEGVNKDKPTSSARFYDTGKGYYWTWSKLSNSVQNQYNQTGSFAFLGDLSTRVKNPSKGVTSSTFDNLKNDANTCWGQTSANMLQYWLDTYGVFYTGSAKLPYGYTYDKKYLSTLGATQSLAMGMYIYDSFADKGGYLELATDWFFKGVVQNPSMMKSNLKTSGGYFKGYFTGDTTVYYSYQGNYSNSHSATTASLAKDLREALGFSATSTSRLKKGQLCYLGLDGIYDGGGHAITCYGMETLDNGAVDCLYVCNSDDLEYKMFPLYVKAVNGQLRLYTDAARTKLWQYAGDGWYVDEVMYINTPTKLVNMYKQYSNTSNPLVWSGKQGTWSAGTGASKFTLRQPAWSDGWAVAVDGTYYPAFYNKNRAVEFNNYSIPKSGNFTRNVTVSGTINLKELRLTVDSKDSDGNYTPVTYSYSFNGTKNAHIKAETLHLANYGFYYFNNVDLTANTLSGENLDDLWLAFYSGTKVTLGGGSWRIPKTGWLLSNATMNIEGLTLLNYGKVRTYGKSTFNGDLELGDNGALSFSFPTTSGNPTPFLTINGGLKISGDAYTEFLGLNKAGVYELASFKTLTGDLSSVRGSFPDYSGDCQFVLLTPNNTLTLVVANSLRYYGNGSSLYNSTDSSGFHNKDNTAVILGYNAPATITVKGTVTPKYVLMAQDSNVVLKDGGSGCISGSANLVKMGKGTLGIELNNTYTGGTKISQGTVITRKPKALGTGSVSLSGGTLNMYSQALSNNVYLNNSACIKGSSAFCGNLILSKGTTTGDAINLVSGKAATIRSGALKNALTGAGKVVKTTTGTVNLYGANTYSGGTSIQAGTLVGRTSTAFGKSLITMTGGTVSVLNQPIINTINVNTASSAVVKGTSAFKGNFVLTKGTVSGDAINLISGKAATLKAGTLKNKLTGAGKVTKSGTGSASIAGANTFTGGTTIQAGTLTAKNATALGKGTVKMTGGTLNMGGYALANTLNIDASTATVKQGGKFKGALTLTKGTVSGDPINLVSGKNATLNKGTLNNQLTGCGNVYKKTSGAVTLAGNNNWTGNTYVQAGTLTLTGNTTLFGTVRTYAGATLNVKNTAYFMNLYLGGGTLTTTATAKINVPGTVTLGYATDLKVSGLKEDAVNFLSYGKLSNKSNLTLTDFFGLTGSGYVVLASNGNLVIAKESVNRSTAVARFAPATDLAMPEIEVPADEVTEEEEAPIAARDITAEELRALLGASGPVFAAEPGSLAQSAWGAAQSARLFDHTVRDHGGHAQTLALDPQGARSVWFAGMSGSSRVHSDGAAMGADTCTYGGVVGMQFNGSMGGNAGLAIGQSYGKVSPMGAARVDQQTQHAAVYGTKMLYASQADSVWLTGTVSYGTTDSDCNSNGHGFEWTQHSIVTGARGTWAHALGADTRMYGFAGMEYLSTNSGDTENGKSGSVQNFQGSIGAGVSHTTGKLSVYADAALEYDFVRHNPTAVSAGQRGGVSTPGRIGVEVRAGANYRINDRWNAEAGYSCHAAQHNTSHEAHIGASYSF